MANAAIRNDRSMEVARPDAHAAIPAGEQSGPGWRRLARIAAAILRRVGRAVAVRKGQLADPGEPWRQILQPRADDMDHLALLLELAVDGDHRAGEDDPAMRLEDALPGERIGDAGLVLQRDEGDIALARPLADQHDAGDADRVAILEAAQRAGRDDAAPRQPVAQE